MTSEVTTNMKMEKKDDPYAGRLSKRLCYLLRYGALKEGLTVHEGGFVDIDQLMSVNMMRHHSREEVLQEIDESLSHRSTKRFEKKQENGSTKVRALFCRKFEPNPCHEGTKVPTLLQTCLDYVASNIQEYDLEDFPDEFLINSMIHSLKRKKKLNSKTLLQLLIPALEHLNLEGVYLTHGILKAMWTGCPNLRFLSFKDCGYIVTDNIVEQSLRKLPLLESLNLAACKHVTDRALTAICRHGNNIRELNLSWIKGLSEKALINLIETRTSLKMLDMFDAKVSSGGIVKMTELAKRIGLTIVLKGLTDEKVAPENPSVGLTNFL